MIFFKYLIASILLSSSIVAEEKGDGWFAVEHPVSADASGEETDPSIWVVFSKELGAEKILVRFPSEPAYQYALSGDFEASAVKENHTFRMVVQETGDISRRVEEILSLSDTSLLSLDRKSDSELDILYLQGEKWIQEHLVSTSHHFYLLQTVGDAINDENHNLFIESLKIENSL